MRNETTVARRTPTMVCHILSFGVIDRNAMMEPGAAGETRPHFMMVNQKMATMLPTMGAMMTMGFMRTYGK